MSTYTKKDDPNSIIVVCEDDWHAHSVQLTYNSYAPETWPANFSLEFLLIPGGFFHRVKQVVKYVFGLNWSFWDDIIIDVETAGEIRDFIDGRLKDGN